MNLIWLNKFLSMLNNTKVILCLCTIMLISHVCLGQEANDQNAKSRKSRPPAEQALITKQVGDFRRVGQANVQHIAAWNRTTAHIHLPDVYRRPTSSLTMSVTIDVPGRKVLRPDVLVLRIFYSQNDYNFNDESSLLVEADDVQFKLGKMRRDHQELIRLGGKISKALAKDIELETFERIANSKQLKMRIADVEFTLSEKQLEAFRDLLRTTEQ